MMRNRRALLLLLGITVLLLLVVGLVLKEMEEQRDLRVQRQIQQLQLRLAHSQQMVIDQREDVVKLTQSFASVVHTALTSERKSKSLSTMSSSLLSLALNSSLSNSSELSELSLPSVQHFLPHASASALRTSFKMAAMDESKRRQNVDLVLAIPTVKRDVQSYLITTLKSLLESMSEIESNSSLIVVFVAEPFDLSFASQLSQELSNHFGPHIDSGLIEIIAPSADFYPDFPTLKPTLGDKMERFVWRTKQCLDYAFLMMYCQRRGLFYVQLEDDVITRPNVVTTMKQYALDASAQFRQRSKRAEYVRDWFLIDFCQLGFIGKLFRTRDLPMFVQFLLMFYKDKPVDWLLESFFASMICTPVQNGKKCKEARASSWLHYKPSLFQHIGTHSSLKGKLQSLKDKQFGRIPLYTPHLNPEAKCESSIKHYRGYTITKAYEGDSLFWGLVPKKDDFLQCRLVTPTKLRSIKIVTGNVEHPLDIVNNATLQVKLLSGSKKEFKFERSDDNFLVVANFDEEGVAHVDLDDDLGPVSVVKVVVHQDGKKWVIISEIQLETTN